MSEAPRRTGVNWRQAAGEALLIFIGVGVALLGQAWWEYRGDREVELHLLEGIRGDLARDTSDLASAMSAARDRVLGADRLLQAVGDPDAGRYVTNPWDLGRPGVRLSDEQWLTQTLAERASVEIPPHEALYMVVSTGSMHRLDVADATFNEATASGQLNVIRDNQLRAAIATYYFDSGRFGDTTDSRVDDQWQHFRRVLSETGLSAIGGETDERILSTLRSRPEVLAELKNVRDNAIYQLGAHDVVLRRAEAVMMLLQEPTTESYNARQARYE
jgi:hypothetical protein